MLFRKFREIFHSEADRIIIVGAGEVGFHLARRVAQEGKNVVVIDLDKSRLDRISSEMDVQTIQGNGASPSILKAAGIGEAKFFLAVTNSDEINLVSCLFAREFAPASVRLARIRNQEYAEYPETFDKNGAGIQMMVHPEQEVVRTIDRLLSLPGALDFARFVDGRVRMVGYKMEKCPLIGEKLLHFRELVQDNNIMVAAILRENTFIIPSGSDTLEIGDTVYFVYAAESQRSLLRILERTRGFFHSACIVGGGKIGVLLAQLFEKKGIEVKLIDKDAARCAELADQLGSTLILNGDGTDKSLLLEENIGKMDVIAAVTGDEESNILACLLAKSMGTRDTVARVNNFAYLPILEHIGIDHSVSSRLAAVNAFQNFIRQGTILNSASVGAGIGTDAGEVLEALLPDGAPLLDTPVKSLNLPGKILLLAVSRGEDVFIPNGSTILQPQDRIILLGSHQDIRKVEPLLAASANAG